MKLKPFTHTLVMSIHSLVRENEQILQWISYLVQIYEKLHKSTKQPIRY